MNSRKVVTEGYFRQYCHSFYCLEWTEFTGLLEWLSRRLKKIGGISQWQKTNQVLLLRKRFIKLKVVFCKLLFGVLIVKLLNRYSTITLKCFLINCTCHSTTQSMAQQNEKAESPSSGSSSSVQLLPVSVLDVHHGKPVRLQVKVIVPVADHPNVISKY